MHALPVGNASCTAQATPLYTQTKPLYLPCLAWVTREPILSTRSPHLYLSLCLVCLSVFGIFFSRNFFFMRFFLSLCPSVSLPPCLSSFVSFSLSVFVWQPLPLLGLSQWGRVCAVCIYVCMQCHVCMHVCICEHYSNIYPPQV